MTGNDSVQKTSARYQLVWFKRDLRINDHQALREAAMRGPVLPVFVVEPEFWALPDVSMRQWAFVRECLSGLRADLARLGQPLIIRVGDVKEVFTELSLKFPISAIHAHEETGNLWTFQRDQAVAHWAKERGVAFNEYRQSGVLRRLKTRNGWAKEWDQFMGLPIFPPPQALTPVSGLDPGSIPALSDLSLANDNPSGRQTGGREAGIGTLTGFLTQRGEHYRREMSSPVTAFTSCSRVSPFLAWGVLSMREVTQETWAHQRELKQMASGNVKNWRGALISFSGRLHWRDHFIQKLEDAPDLEQRNLHSAYDGLRPSTPDPIRLQAWTNGETGLPFVDACMRALKETGWMNFRMRAMLVAVSSYHLWLDWKAPGEHLARLFTDYEPGIHWPQVQMQSGTTGINTIRMYNPVKQGKDQDPEGDFIRRFLPELADIPDAFIHEPWTWPDAHTLLGKTYPFPVIDHLAAARDARQKVWAIRQGGHFYTEADAIQEKHGSRKSGIKMTGQKKAGSKTSKKTAEQGGQFDLPL